LALAALGLVTTGFLTAWLIPRLGWLGLHAYAGGRCPFCGGTGVFNPWGLLVTLMIVLLMISIPLSHIAVLLASLRSLTRSESTLQPVELSIGTEQRRFPDSETLGHGTHETRPKPASVGVTR